jgi:hypothetical protein
MTWSLKSFIYLILSLYYIIIKKLWAKLLIKDYRVWLLNFAKNTEGSSKFVATVNSRAYKKITQELKEKLHSFLVTFLWNRQWG